MVRRKMRIARGHPHNLVSEKLLDGLQINPLITSWEAKVCLRSWNRKFLIFALLEDTHSLLLDRYYNIMRISQDTFFLVLVEFLFLNAILLDPFFNFLKVELGQSTTLDQRYLSLSYPLIDGIFTYG
jgi:hypothetical protein